MVPGFLPYKGCRSGLEVGLYFATADPLKAKTLNVPLGAKGTGTPLPAPAYAAET